MTPNHISGDELSELKRYVLEASRKILVENVDAPRFLPYFRSKFILDQRECDQIKSCSRQSRYDGAEKLLDALLTKGGSGYDHFCAAIMYDQTQMFLLTTLNKRLEILRDWRKNQVAADHQVHQAQYEMMMKERAQVHLNRQQQMRYSSTMYPSNGRNRTYPLMTAASSYSGQRYPSSHSVPPTSKVMSAAPYQPELHRQQNLPPPEPERLPRSPVPMEEPMTPPNTQFLPHPNHLEGPGPGGNNCYPPFIEPQIAEQGHNIMAAQQLNQSHPVYNHHHHHHPSFHPSAAQPPIPLQQQQQQQQAGVHQTLGGGGGYSTAANYPPQAILHSQHYPPGGCVPPTEPMYPVPVGGGAYYEHHIPPAPAPHHHHHHHHHDVLTLNTPTGAMMENLLPGMPPPPVSACAAASPHSVHPATGANHHHESETGEAESHRLSGSSPQYTQSSYGLLLASSAAAATTGHGYATGNPSKDILCGQGGN